MARHFEDLCDITTGNISRVAKHVGQCEDCDGDPENVGEEHDVM
jgi:hypothetical protein